MSYTHDEIKKTGGAAVDNTMVLRVPKPNMLVVVLGLVAAITLFQTVQIWRLGATAASSPSVRAVSAPAASAPTQTAGTGSSAQVPESMVGGC